MPALPIIDLSLTDSDPGRLHRELLATSGEIGFFYLTGHGVPAERFDEVLIAARAFFARPEEEKDEISQLGSPHFRGYSRVGTELTNRHADWREQIDIGPERAPVSDAVGFWNLEGPNRWPASPPQFRRVFEEWYAALTTVGHRLLAEWAAALGADPHVFEQAFERPSSVIKVVRYPGSDEAEQGVGAHKDSGVLTLLLAEPGSSGLQVEAEPGRWIEVTPIPGTFVVNIGELLEVATGGYLRATRHRVLAPPAGADRVSVPFFFNPTLDARMPILDIARQGAGVETDPDNPIFDTYGANAWKSRLRAHPVVAELHHGVRPAGAPSTY